MTEDVEYAKAETTCWKVQDGACGKTPQRRWHPQQREEQVGNPEAKRSRQRRKQQPSKASTLPERSQESGEETYLLATQSPTLEKV